MHSILEDVRFGLRMLAKNPGMTRAADSFGYASGTILLAVVVLLGCYIPARRATRVNPMSAPRYE